MADRKERILPTDSMIVESVDDDTEERCGCADSRCLHHPGKNRCEALGVLSIFVVKSNVRFRCCETCLNSMTYRSVQ